MFLLSSVDLVSALLPLIFFSPVRLIPRLYQNQKICVHPNLPPPLPPPLPLPQHRRMGHFAHFCQQQRPLPPVIMLPIHPAPPPPPPPSLGSTRAPLQKRKPCLHLTMVPISLQPQANHHPILHSWAPPVLVVGLRRLSPRQRSFKYVFTSTNRRVNPRSLERPIPHLKCGFSSTTREIPQPRAQVNRGE